MSTTLRFLSAIMDKKRNEKLTREKLLEKQNKSFRKLVHHAYKHSPYYKEIIDQNKIDVNHCSPKDFPVLTKNELRLHFDKIVTDRRVTKEGLTEFLKHSESPHDKFLGRYYVTQTSGTSGEPGVFIYTEAELLSGLSHAYRYRTPGIKKRSLFVGFPSKHATSSVALGAAGLSLLNRILYDYKAVNIDQPWENVLAEIQDYQPNILSAYAKLMVYFSDAQRQGLINIKPEAVECGGEPLLATDRKYIEETFGCKVVNNYGCTEHLVMGASVNGDGLSLYEDDLIFELREDFTAITNLYNYGLPLIRYRLDDVLTPKKSGNEKSPFQVVEEFIGRAEEIPMLKTVNGGKEKIHPICFDRIVVDSVKTFQLHCGEEKIAMSIVFKPEVNESSKAKDLADIHLRFSGLLKELGAAEVSLVVEEAQQFKRNKNQKTSFSGQ